MKKRQFISIIYGGTSSERGISIQTAHQVFQALSKRYRVKKYDIAKDFWRFMREAKLGNVEIVFNALHGQGGEDGKIQGFLDLLKIPYTGSGVLASALAMDKAMAKRIFHSSGIPTPPGMLLTKNAWKSHPIDLIRRIKSELGSNIVVKPNASGSSVGISVRPRISDWPKAIRRALKEDSNDCLAEKYLKGTELSVGVIGADSPTALPVIEIRSRRKFYDYKAKYEDDATEAICPAAIPKKVSDEAKSLALRCHAALGCHGYSRTDMIWHAKGIDVLETNTLPGLTTHSLLPKAASSAGIAFDRLLDSVLHWAKQRARLCKNHRT